MVLVKRWPAAFLGIVLVAFPALAVWRLSPRLPPPAESNREQLMRWLVLADLSEQPRGLQVDLLNGLQAESAREVLPADRLSELSDRHRRQLEANVAVLKPLWFAERVREFGGGGSDSATAFLDEQLRFVAAVSTASGAGASTLLAELDDWIGALPAADRPAARTAMNEAFVRWLETSPLDGLSLSSRRAVVLRVARELNEMSSQPTAPPTHSGETLFRENALLLMEGWLYNSATDYRGVPAAERSSFIDARIDEFQRWNLLSLFVKPNAKGGSTLAAALAMNVELEKWLARADGEEKPTLQAFTDDIRARLVARQLRR